MRPIYAEPEFTFADYAPPAPELPAPPDPNDPDFTEEMIEDHLKTVKQLEEAYFQAVEAAQAAMKADQEAHFQAFMVEVKAWEAEQRAKKEASPYSPHAGTWLKRNPVAGVECVDGYLVGWPEGMPHPDLASFEIEYQAEKDAEASQFNADIEALDTLRKQGDPTARTLLRLLGR